ncbi:hypothetical protein WP3W18E02_19780 [Klebsiella sp. WP3-W18-ESBL-02]|uniref:phage tail terminator-like protein n=1 Tax=Klebsiella sp. WP3-W18-ESBL-02 TaxID=2675710 RepID=UPI0015DCA857|nr:phage tail terminator-like protein [Klebsiella sp. WP3-W18-ESBL-02]BBQ83449.1 hypothetical protein WP3W18E02_19780 [Klebsiella sp. WP3-W18-ESBL-02]
MIPDISATLNAYLGRWADQHGVPLFLDNITADKPAETYLEAYELPATPQTLDLGMTCHVYTGIYQVNIVIPAGAGTAQGRYLARKVASIFLEGQSISGDGFRCWISAPPAIFAGVLNSRKTNYSIPVSIRYRVDTTS